MREADVFTRAKALMESAPDLVKLKVIGFSGTENLPIYSLEIGRNKAQRDILLIGQHHGDEVLGVELALAWAEELVRKSSSDKQINAILKQYRFCIIPTINPEGYRIVTSGLLPNKRKNNRPIPGSTKPDLRTDGVDLNRNYPVFWDEDIVTPPTHQNYKGSAPASEPEVQAVLNLAQKHSFELAMFFHSSPTGDISEKIFLPALDSLNVNQKQRFQTTRAWAENYAGYLKRDYQSGNYTVSAYPGSRVGLARNYFFHIRETNAFLVEIGGVNRDGISVVHPSAKMRDKIVSKHLKALRKMFTDKLI